MFNNDDDRIIGFHIKAYVFDMNSFPSLTKVFIELPDLQKYYEAYFCSAPIVFEGSQSQIQAKPIRSMSCYRSFSSFKKELPLSFLPYSEIDMK